MSPFVPGGVSDGQWHTVQLKYYNKVCREGMEALEGSVLGPGAHPRLDCTASGGGEVMALLTGIGIGSYYLVGHFHPAGQWSVPPGLDMEGVRQVLMGAFMCVRMCMRVDAHM